MQIGIDFMSIINSKNNYYSEAELFAKFITKSLKAYYFKVMINTNPLLEKINKKSV
jgi:hypothetical protein